MNGFQSQPRTSGFRMTALSIALALATVPMGAIAADWRVLTRDGAFDSFFNELEKEKEAPYYTQVKDTAYTFIGRQDLTTTRGGFTRCFAKPVAMDYQPADAWLLEASSDVRVLMFNEHHDHVAPRAFVYRMLPALRKQGFTHLAMEGLGLDKGEPLGPASGIYSQEPLFAALIRRAQALGFELVAYEHLPKENDIALREQGQAENLAAAVEAAGVDARFVVYAGAAHITERPMSNGAGQFIRWMAGRFAELSGIDPFTVNLSDCAYRADSPFEARVAVDAAGRVLVGGSHDGLVDAQIQLPLPSAPQLGFYRQLLGEPTTFALPPIAASESVLVRAWLPDDVVPLDQVLVRSGETATLYLPTGTHRVTVNTGDGTVIASDTVMVSKR